MLAKFNTYQLALKFHRECSGLRLRGPLDDQMFRATTSIALNLAEGSAKHSRKERARFYQISLASLREAQAILEIAGHEVNSDHLGASLYRLIQNPGPDL